MVTTTWERRGQESSRRPEGGAVTDTETGSGLSGDADANSHGGTLKLHVVERRANYLLKTLLFPLWDTQKNL